MFDDYIGIPFQAGGKTREGCDCWRLLCLIYKEQLNIDLPDYADVTMEDNLSSLLKITKLMKQDKDQWQKVDVPNMYDMVLLRTGNMLYHAGMIIDRNKMIHVDRGIDSVIERFDSHMWKDRVEGFYRYKDLM